MGGMDPPKGGPSRPPPHVQPTFVVRQDQFDWRDRICQQHPHCLGPSWASQSQGLFAPRCIRQTVKISRWGFRFLLLLWRGACSILELKCEIAAVRCSQREWVFCGPSRPWMFCTKGWFPHVVVTAKGSNGRRCLDWPSGLRTKEKASYVEAASRSEPGVGAMTDFADKKSVFLWTRCLFSHLPPIQPVSVSGFGNDSNTSLPRSAGQTNWDYV